MLFLVRELDDFVLDRRAVARAGSRDLTGIHRRAHDVLADEAQRFRRGVGDVAGDLPTLYLFGPEAERGRVCVSRLLLELAPVDRAAIEARRCSGLEAAATQPQALQCFAEQDRGRFAAASCGVIFLAAVN